MILAIVAIIFGSQPCGSDGCMIRLLVMIGVPVLLLSAIGFWLTFWYLRKLKKNS